MIAQIVAISHGVDVFVVVRCLYCSFKCSADSNKQRCILILCFIGACMKLNNRTRMLTCIQR